MLEIQTINVLFIETYLIHMYESITQNIIFVKEYKLITF